MHIIVQTTGRDEYSLNVEIEIPNKILADITGVFLLKSIHKKQIWYFAYQYAICISHLTDNRFRGDVIYFLCNGSIPAYKCIKYVVWEST